MAHTRGLVIKINKDGIAQVVTDRKNACGAAQRIGVTPDFRIPR